MIETINIEGYRSLVRLRLNLRRVTVVRGANGVGKSNFYRALRLLRSLAEGSFAKAVAEDGGMPGLLWTGNDQNRRSTRFSIQLDAEEFGYDLECGLVPDLPGSPNPFKLDPDIKTETLRSGKRALVKRNAAQYHAANSTGVKHSANIGSTRSVLSALNDPESYPLLAHAKNLISGWRFYDAIRTDAQSPARQPVRGYWSPVLTESADNLPSVVQTILCSDQHHAFLQVIADAWPSAYVEVRCGSFFELQLVVDTIPRPLTALEMSDGTLRFICLAAALLSPEPPALIVLNEPETSLNQDLLPALAGLIARASERSQMIVVTHSEHLATAIAERTKTKNYELIMTHGETRLAGQEKGKRVWVFDDDDDEED